MKMGQKSTFLRVIGSNPIIPQSTRTIFLGDYLNKYVLNFLHAHTNSFGYLYPKTCFKCGFNRIINILRIKLIS